LHSASSMLKKAAFLSIKLSILMNILIKTLI